jgi:hypothetical protein
MSISRRKLLSMAAPAALLLALLLRHSVAKVKKLCQHKQASSGLQEQQIYSRMERKLV